MQPSIRIAICHANQLLADCMLLSLNQLYEYDCQVLTPESAVEDVSGIDVLLLDASLPEPTTTGVMEYAKKLNSNSHVLLIVSQHVASRMLEFTRLGADGCIFDQSSLDELHHAVATVARGETYCSQHAANALFTQAGRRESDPNWSEHLLNVRLTAREREVLELIAWEQLGNKQIAYRLNISLYTVKNHVHNIIEKLGVDDRQRAAETATRMMLIGSR